ncbi:MAG: cellulase family glycosylhydrolase [Planctomycetes bacterium]|nr:cellulase family glycosylhydrolase [Planctomycetota bacterium]
MRLRFAVICCCLCLAELAHAVEPAPMNFITRRGDRLYDGDKPFRFISFNIPNLMVIEDAYEFTKPNPWRWPNEFEIEDALESVRQMGGQVVRTYVVSVYRDGSDMGKFVHVLGPGQFNEEGFRALDMLVAAARRKGIRVIIPLVDQHKWWGGIGEYAAFRGKPAEAFWSDRQIIDDFKATVEHVVARKNSLTGVAYRDEPAIFGWQTGNEISSTPEWTREMAAYIKELDPNHVVLDGKSLKGVPVWSLDDPNIDVITTHHYPWGADHDYVKPIREAHALTKGKKAYFVGEFGFVETPHIASAIEAVIEDGISGALLWSLRMHRREGGFYWHMEVGTGRNIYKAYHWPGFASGDRYDERQILQLVREKAHQIRGLPTPLLEKPAPPKLLPIDRVSAISWQGAAGADSYDVWRSATANADWRKIADAVSDADVQYQPLFNDQTADPGRQYFYRVVARNSAGASEPSNVVGPVNVECRTLVDECRDLAQTSSTTGRVAIATENARTTQEDSHRLAISPGSSVVYSVDGPIDHWRVFSFAGNENTRLEFAVSRDGITYKPITVKREEFQSGQTVYGYLTPVLYEGEAQGGNNRYLRLTLPAAVATSAKQDAAPLEIGRIEIEFDKATRTSKSLAMLKRDVRPTPMNATVFIDNPLFIQDTLASIDKAAARGDRWLNVAVTILVDLTQDLRVKSYGWFRRPGRGFEPCNDEMRATLQDASRRVFARMVEHDMDIYILPHVDAGGRVRTWRNWYDFDPLEEYSGYSYDDLMINSIADALAESVKPDTRVEMALSGEMGTSLFRYPESYRKIVRQLRARPDLDQLKFGISLNHGGISGQGNPTGVKNIELTDDGRRQMQSLINECDFVGMSFYRPVGAIPTPHDFVRGIDHFMSEFAAHGLSVPTSKPMHFSEVGIGGGHREDDDAADPAKAVLTPWEGSGDERANPWRTEPMQNLRRQYHRALLEFLATQPAKWNVSAAFFWSTGSWDPQGMRHPAFADPEIVRAIQRHNESIAAGR